MRSRIDASVDQGRVFTTETDLSDEVVGLRCGAVGSDNGRAFVSAAPKNSDAHPMAFRPSGRANTQ